MESRYEHLDDVFRKPKSVAEAEHLATVISSLRLTACSRELDYALIWHEIGVRVTNRVVNAGLSYRDSSHVSIRDERARHQRLLTTLTYSPLVAIVKGAITLRHLPLALKPEADADLKLAIHRRHWDHYVTTRLLRPDEPLMEPAKADQTIKGHGLEGIFIDTEDSLKQLFVDVADPLKVFLYHFSPSIPRRIGSLFGVCYPYP